MVISKGHLTKEKFTNYLFEQILESYNHIQTIKVDKEKKKSKVFLHDKNIFFPKEIQKYINNNVKYQIIYKANINGKNVTLNLFHFSELTTHANRHALFIFMIIYMLSLHTRSACSKHLNIDIYFTHFKRHLPPGVLDQIDAMNINGGFSYCGCNTHTSFTVYRKEGWYKVLIHEICHSLCFDFSTLKLNVIIHTFPHLLL